MSDEALKAEVEDLAARLSQCKMSEKFLKSKLDDMRMELARYEKPKQCKKCKGEGLIRVRFGCDYSPERDCHSCSDCRGTGKRSQVSQAFDVLKQAMRDDPMYAHSWHCKVAMSMYDELPSMFSEEYKHVTSNIAASRFMQLCFGVTTSKDSVFSAVEEE